MHKFGLHGKLTAKENCVDDMISILLKASQLIEKLETCQLYLISKTENTPNDVWITEMWDSKEAYD